MKIIIEERIDFIIEQVGWGRWSWQGIGEFRFIRSAIVFNSPFEAATHAQAACSNCIIYDTNSEKMKPRPGRSRWPLASPLTARPEPAPAL